MSIISCSHDDGRPPCSVGKNGRAGTIAPGDERRGAVLSFSCATLMVDGVFDISADFNRVMGDVVGDAVFQATCVVERLVAAITALCNRDR